jgi:hypothetical protein
MDQQKPYFYRSNIQLFIRRLIVGLAILLMGLDILLHRHSHFAKQGVESLDGAFGFYGFTGAIGSLALIIIVVIVSKVLKVSEDYYVDDF